MTDLEQNTERWVGTVVADIAVPVGYRIEAVRDSLGAMFKRLEDCPPHG